MLRANYWIFFTSLLGVLVAVGAAVQLIVLPFLFPSISSGEGLLVGGDLLGFHQTATKIAEQIRREGWQNWQLQPHGWGHVGLSSALYALVAPQPWILIPVSAALMAGALTMLRRILVFMGIGEAPATRAVCILLLLPSTIMIATQWHKDSFAVPSTIAVTLGLVLFWRGEKMISGFFLIISGLLGLWLVRSHIIQVVAVGALIGVGAAALTANWRAWDARRNIFRLAAAAVALFIVAIAIPDWTDRPGDSNVDQNEGLAWSVRLPHFLDRRIEKISRLRDASMHEGRHGCATIGHDVRFDNAVSLISYLPRAAAIAFFSPFPAQWIEADCHSGGRILRLIGGAEMLVAYAMFLAIPWLAWRQRSHPVFWFVIISYLVALLVHAIVIVNTGTLFRVRYAWFTLFIALGIAGWISLAGTRFGTAQRKGLGSTDASRKQRE